MNNKNIEMSESRRGLFNRFNNQPAQNTTDGLLEETLGDRLLDLGISRRGFMQFCVGMAAMIGLPPTIRNAMADECMKLKPSVIYMSFQECTGCLESLVNSGSVGFLPTSVLDGIAGLLCLPKQDKDKAKDASKIENLILNVISLDYQETIMAASGAAAEGLREKLIEDNKNKFVLVVDGSIPVPDPSKPETFGYFVSGGKSGVQRFLDAAHYAEAVVAVGTCASFGGLPHAFLPDKQGMPKYRNPTGAVPIHHVMEMNGLLDGPNKKTLVTIPGCPPIAEVIVSVLLYYFLNKSDSKTYPLVLDGLNRPTLLYGSTVHGPNCDRFSYLQDGKFAKSFDDDPFSPVLPSGARQGYCLLERGCKGPVTHNACTTVKWNQGTGYPMKSGHGCIACSEPNFWDGYYPRVWSPTAGRPRAQSLTWEALKDPAKFGFKKAGFYDELEDPTAPPPPA